jgi:transcriptional/translational regulatory protein YebC/TACO1
VETAIEVDIDDIDFIENPDAHDPESEKKPVDLIVTNADQLSKLQDVMEKLNISGSSNLAYLPKERVATSDDDFEKNSKLVEGFEDLDDVDTVFHNMELK